MKKNRFSIINNFPLIIMVVAAVLIVVLVNVYLTFKPHDVIYETGYMALSNNMAYNLINNNSINDSLNVEAISVNVGDSIYKQIDSYYVGEEEKKEIDYGYPIYSQDGLTIYPINDKFILIDKNFEISEGYPGLSINYGIIYNDGEDEPADPMEYLFIKLNNSIFINSQFINIQTEEKEYNIPINSPVYFNTKYINYYAFDGEKFNYNRISNIEYDSVIKIGDVSLTYEELLLKMDVAKKVDIEDYKEKLEEERLNGNDSEIENETGEGNDTSEGDGSGEGAGSSSEENSLNSILGEYVEPVVTIESVDVNTYSISSNVTITDPSGVITSNPTFEIHNISTKKLDSRKRVVTTGLLKMAGLTANTEYKIVGKYTYKNRFGSNVTKKFYEEHFKTKGIENLEPIKIKYESGIRYSNKIEIKDFTILNLGIEALNGLKKITIQTWEKDNPDDVKKTNIPSNLLNKILKGEPTTIYSNLGLNSDTVYDYDINFYDKSNNELKLDGKNSGTVKTSLMDPVIASSYKYDYDENNVTIKITTKNTDNVEIDRYRYEFYKGNDELIEQGELDYENNKENELSFLNLMYGTEYYLKIKGNYDLEDGNGEKEIEKTLPSKTPFYIPYPTTITAWYDSWEINVTDSTINAGIYISKNANILSKENGFVKVYLEDSEGNIAKDKYGNEINERMFVNGDVNEGNVYQNISSPNSYFIENLNYENLNSNTKYVLKVSAGLLSADQDDGIDFETKKFAVGSPITTPKQMPYLEVTNKFLHNNNLIFEYKIVDKDNVIANNTVRIDIYDKNCSDGSCLLSQISATDNIYGQQINMLEKDENGEIEGKIYQDGYYSENYTIAVSYVQNEKEYIKVIEGDQTSDYVEVNAAMSLFAQMTSQTYEENDKTTTSNFEVTSKASLYDLKYYDCAYDGTNCNEVSEPTEIDSGVQITIKNTGDQGQQKRMYVVKPQSQTQSLSSDQIKIEDAGYILDYVEYTTNKNIYEISDVDDFRLLGEKNSEQYPEAVDSQVRGNYVVTKDLNFSSSLPENRAYFELLNGVLDFQGHKVTFEYNDNNNKQFIRKIGENGELKNIELDIYFNAATQLSMTGFIYENNGTIQDIIVNMFQDNKVTMEYRGLVHNNLLKGKINRFIIYLKSDLYVEGYSTLGVYANRGTINNGYIATHPDEGVRKVINVNTHFGLIAWQNYNSIKNIYNLVDVKETNKQLRIGTIAYTNKSGGSIRNSLNVSKTAIIRDKRGPNIYENSSTVNNNYYVDINLTSGYYDYEQHPYNIPINEELLTNKFFMESLFNDDKQFNISSWNYPTLKLSNFLQRKQKNIKLDLKNNLGAATSISLVLAKSAESDQRNVLDDEDVLQISGLTSKTWDIYDDSIKETYRTLAYQTSQIELYFNNPNGYKITSITVKDPVNKSSEISGRITSTSTDPQTGMTIVSADLTLENGIATSSYKIDNFCYKINEFVKEQCKYNINKDISVDMFKRVTNYDELLTSIKQNENILITNDIEVDKELSEKVESDSLTENHYINLPVGRHSSLIYSAKLYGVVDSSGKGITIDFDNKEMTRGYFFPNFSGTLKNIQIKNFKVSSSNGHIGFINNLSQAIVDNVDISDSSFTYEDIDPKTGEEKCDIESSYVGPLAAFSDGLVFVSRTSSNNNTIKIKDNSIKDNYVGGLIGWTNQTEINDSYTYNINISTTTDMGFGNLAIGGLAAYTKGSQIKNVYTTGNIDSKYSNIGGIIGSNDDSIVDGAYSYISIFSTGKNIGGIAGSHTDSSKNYYNNVMFIGFIDGSSSSSYLIPTQLDNINKILSGGYVLETYEKKLNYGADISSLPVTSIGENQLKEFDKNEAFYIIDSKLPYLGEASFVEQQVRDTTYQDLNEKITVGYSYITSGEDVYLYKDIGENVVSNKARITISGVAENPLVESDELDLSDDQYDKVKQEYTVTATPKSLYKDYYTIKIGSVSQKIKLPFYRIIDSETSETDWQSISTTENENIYIAKDIKITPADNLVNKKLNNVVGNGYTIYYGTDTICNITDDDNDDDDNYDITKTKLENLDLGSNNFATWKKCVEGEGNGNLLTLEQPLIKSLTGTMKGIHFKNFEIKYTTTTGAGLILFNSGTISNESSDGPMFENIKVGPNDETTVSDKVGIIALNSGYVNDITIKNILISGKNYVGGLIAYDVTSDQSVHVKNINAENISINGTYALGGIHGYSYYQTEGLNIKNFYINWTYNEKNTGSIGGILGVGNCKSECKASNGVMVVGGTNIGGIQGIPSTSWNSSSNLEVRNIDIYNKFTYAATYVGGISGQHHNVNGSYVENLNLYSSYEKKGEVKGHSIGGVVGKASGYIKNSYVKNSNISASRVVGGVVGFAGNGTMENNVVFNVSVTGRDSADLTSVGGIVGGMSGSAGTPHFEKNLVYSVTLSGPKAVGGIVGSLNNDSASSQAAAFSNNIVGNLDISYPENSGVGGIIGTLAQVPTHPQLFKNSVYVVKDNVGLTSIGTNDTDFIGELKDSYNFKQVEYLVDFKNVFGASKSSETLVYSNLEKLKEFTLERNDYITYISDEEGTNYIPLTNITSWRDSSLKIPIFTQKDEDEYEYIVDPSGFVPFSQESASSQSASYAVRNLMTARSFMTSFNSSAPNEQKDLDLDVYASDANKINIDFSDIDEYSTFSYKIGDYISPTIPILNRTFTISYDFKEPIKIILDSAGGLETTVIKPNDLIRTISYVGDKVYYINNGLLYSEDKVITGSFVNLYDNKVLTSSGMVYNISTKEESDAFINYGIDYDAKPLYEFEYNGGKIETYYNYSIYNSIIKNYQILYKNGLINIIDESIDNKKNSYIVDFYNGNEVQIVLKNDGVLYSLKGNIKYPSDFDNQNILDLYVDLKSNNNIAVIKYESGEVYAFDYLTGDKVFTSVSKENVGFFDYIKDKIGSKTNNTIVNLVPAEEYTEMNLLKEKLSEVSIEEANDKLSGNNSSEPVEEKEYVSVYNDVTKKYDLYEVENLLNSLEIQSENDEISRDYELVQFYETINKKEKQKSVSGIIVFTLSIVAILATLYILIRRKKVRG